jgi:hypothetical protein
MLWTAHASPSAFGTRRSFSLDLGIIGPMGLCSPTPPEAPFMGLNRFARRER